MIFRRRSRPPLAASLQPQLSPPAARGRRLGQAALFDRIVARIKDHPGPHHLVDLGCGSGVLSLRLVQTCPGLQVTGIEPSTNLVRLATRAAADARVSARLTFMRSDLRTLPIPDLSVDLVAAAGLLAEAISPQTLLAEICRILTPHGTAFLVEPLLAEVDPNPIRSNPLTTRDLPALTATQIRRLISSCPLHATAVISEPPADGPLSFLDITLTRPPRDPPRPSSRR